MIQRIVSFAEQYDMIKQGEYILAGISGGADSVCMLLVLVRLKELYDLKITAVHVEHGIRGEDSIRDAEFVSRLCERLDVPCCVYHCDALAFSREQRMTLEEGARELRYRYFRQLKEQIQADKIAVAHNQNDCAETLLFHLTRGAGLKGMCGIAPKRDCIIRPLLCVSREEIEGFLAEEGQDYCVDATNLETEYSRNRIRHQVLPVLKEINAGAVEHLYQSTEDIAEALELAEHQVQLAKESCVRKGPREDSCLLTDQLTGQPGLIRKLLVQQLVAECAGSRKDIGRIHVEQVLQLFDRQVGRGIMLPYGVWAERTYQGILIRKQQKEEMGLQESADSLELMPEEMQKIPGTDLFLTGRILEKTKEIKEIPQKTYTKWFDYDKIKGALLVRKRRPGDYFVMDDRGQRQLLKKYFINEKVPSGERSRIFLLADGQHVVWIIGYRISEAYKVTEDTKRILEVRVNGGSINE